jgi:serine/threonine protein kinase
VHRDLKPANIKISPDGVVKVLDFGLGKTLVDGGNDQATRHETREGLILGTPAYMSPEQARGLVVDKRSDIWSFGCVLFEMITGRQAFDGEDVADTLGRVLQREPDWRLLPDATPASLQRLVVRCLEKDRNKVCRRLLSLRSRSTRRPRSSLRAEHVASPPAAIRPFPLVGRRRPRRLAPRPFGCSLQLRRLLPSQ